jgi:membrane fusion protein (multidrug efflux system)
VQAAELNLSYARVAAPADGYVTKKAVESGDYIQVGQKLMALVPSDLYVTANFKETQVEHIRPGQPVRIVVDSVEGRVFAGHVDSIMAGSGARFSLLPPENAVGNYVKVVQRIPVKILFDEPVEAGHVLGPGMSVVPSVKVKGYEVSEAIVVAVAAVVALVFGALWWRAAACKKAVA